MKPMQTTLLISPMRNEGPFILEWLAWHRAIGFDDILILSNDCTDGSDNLLDALAARGLLTHLRHEPDQGSFALRSAFKTARRSPLIETADWVMVLDADEFLIIHDGGVQDLIARHTPAPLGIAIHWQCFGDNGHEIWEPGLLRQQFTRCGPTQSPANMRFKSIFRNPTRFASFSSHTPLEFNDTWGDENIWITSDGQRLNKINLTSNDRVQSTAMRRITHDVAQVNHYAVKAQNCLTERRAKWQSSNRDYRYNEEFIARYNINTHSDHSALSREADFEAAYRPLIEDPELAALEAACIKAYQAALKS